MNETILRITGELFGAIAICESFFIYFSSTREKMLIFKMIADALWLISYLCIGGPTGVILNGVAMMREIVFYLRDKSSFFGKRIWLPLFIAATLVSPVLSMVNRTEGLYALLPAMGSTLAVIGFYQRNPEFSRRIGFFAQTLWLLYAIFVVNYSSIVCSLVLIISAIVGSARARYSRKRALPSEDTGNNQAMQSTEDHGTRNRE